MIKGEILEIIELIEALKEGQMEEDQKRKQIEKEVEELKKMISAMREEEEFKELMEIKNDLSL